MITLAAETVDAYSRRMAGAGVPEPERGEYLRWVRFYLDFCQKYSHPPREEGSLPRFLEKLASKKQTDAARGQAGRAVELLLRGARRSLGDRGIPRQEAGSEGGMCAEEAAPDGREGVVAGCEGERRTVERAQAGACGRGSGDGDARERAVQGVSWVEEYRGLEGAIRLRNYSGKTHEADRMWVRKFQAFTRSKAPGELDTEDVKAFLTDLAVRQEVAGSTQNQAFNALLFFYRQVLRREFGKVEGVVRAKRKPYVPVVLSRQEVEAVLAEIEPPYRLVALLLYGSGLRLAECLELRVHCFNLDARLLTIHDGKGQKDRSVPLPERILPEIRAQMEEVRRTLRADLEAGAAGTFLPKQLEKKYRNAAREYIWQSFFPATTLTEVAGSGEKRRYHLHQSHVQAAVKRAAGAAGMTKRVSPHTFRHTFASHLLMGGYDLPTIQKLLGHGDVKTTMIYVQTVPTMTVKEVRSPLDFAMQGGAGK